MEETFGKQGDFNDEAKNEYQKAKSTKKARTIADIPALDAKVVSLSQTFNPNQVASMLMIPSQQVKDILSKY